MNNQFHNIWEQLIWESSKEHTPTPTFDDVFKQYTFEAIWNFLIYRDLVLLDDQESVEELSADISMFLDGWETTNA